MISSYLFKLINFFDLQQQSELLPFQLLEEGGKVIERFKHELVEDLSQMNSEIRIQTLENIRYSLNRKLGEYSVGFETIQYWINKYQVTYDELLQKPEDNALVLILKDMPKIHDKNFKEKHPYIENVQEDFYVYWAGLQISNALEILTEIENPNSKVNATKKKPGLSIAEKLLIIRLLQSVDLFPRLNLTTTSTSLSTLIAVLTDVSDESEVRRGLEKVEQLFGNKPLTERQRPEKIRNINNIKPIIPLNNSNLYF